MQSPDARRSRFWIFALVIAIALVAIAVRTLRADRPAASDRTENAIPPAETATPVVEETAAPIEDVTHLVEPPVAAAPRLPVTDVPPPEPTLDLQTAEANLETAATLLREGRDDDFIATFLPAVRPQFTPRAIERCRARVVTSNTPLRPDWETAEESMEDGHRVRRVSLYGHETTGFHQVDGRWLADRAWCVPTDVPDDA